MIVMTNAFMQQLMFLIDTSTHVALTLNLGLSYPIGC